MILSIHIPKTAGISVRNALHEQFGLGFILYYGQITDAAGRLFAEVPAHAECVHGHFHADLLASRFPQAPLITWVRDPVERVISSYYHRLRESAGQHPAGHDAQARSFSLPEFAALPLMRNEMTRFFGGHRPEEFAFIGIVERSDRSFARLRALLGQDHGAIRSEIPDGEQLAPQYSVSPDVRKEIARLNEADVALHRECLERDERAVGTPGALSAWSDPSRVATGT